MKSPIVTLNEKDLLAAKKKLNDLKAKQEKLRDEELEIRNYIADTLFPEEEGSKTFTFGDLKVAVKRNLNYSITQADAELLTQKHGNISLEVLSWSPRVKVGGFKEHAEVVAEFVTVKPGPPSIEWK